MSFLVNKGSTPSPNSTPQSSSNFIGRGLDVIHSNGTLSDRSSFHGVMHRNVNHEGMQPK